MSKSVAIQHALTGIYDEGVSRQLLQTAAIQTVQRQGAYISPSTQYAAPDAYRRDKRPVCDMAALQYLEILLDSYDSAILWQWTMLIHARQQRAPDEYLPILLDAGHDISWMLQAHLREFLGKRALWLVHQGYKQRPHWRWITDVRLHPGDAARSAHNLQHKVTRVLRDTLHDRPNWQFMDELRFREFPWTDHLTRNFMLYLNVQATAAHNDSRFPPDLKWMLAHYIPVSAQTKLIRSLQQLPAFAADDLHYIDHVISFRRRLAQDLDGVSV